jgi:hypothetical protein
MAGRQTADSMVAYFCLCNKKLLAVFAQEFL